MDGVLALALTVFAQLDLRFNIEQAEHFGPELVVALVTGVVTSVLVLRRRAPLATAVVVAVATAGPQLFTTLTIQLWGDFVPLLIAAYSAVRHGRRHRDAVAGAVAVGLAMLVIWSRVPSIHSWQNIPFTFVPYAAAVVAGRAMRVRAERHRAQTELVERLEAEHDESVQAALADERGRIARELHDMVAHSVSVMVVQAGAAEALLDRDADAARRPLRAVQEVGQQAVVDLGRMLGLLRGEDDAGGADGGEEGHTPRAPQPGTARLPDLVERVTHAGVPVALRVEGEPRALPPGLDLTVYRVVQEALTNTLKHAQDARAEVVVRYGPRDVVVEVTDDGRARAGMPPRRSGRGLVGMRERVTLYGGTLAAGPRRDGGFAVRAELPVEAGA